MSKIDVNILRCPLNGDRLNRIGETLVSTMGESYPIIQGVPVLLTKTKDPTLWVLKSSYDSARHSADNEFFEDTIGYSPAQLIQLKKQLKQNTDDFGVDPIISFLIGATSGYMYQDLVGSLTEIPIPKFRLPVGAGMLLDIGCNWGRWSISAARSGYTVIGIDPSLGAVLAAKRLCKKLGIDALFVVGDALRLPFAPSTFDQIFSYSVLQHFSYADCETAIAEASKISKESASLLIQMPNMYGIRSFYHFAKRKFQPGTGFAVRYYTPSRLLSTFEKNFGPSQLSVDCYFGLGIQPSDRHLVSGSKKVIIDASETLRFAAKYAPFMKNVADSLYVSSVKN